MEIQLESTVARDDSILFSDLDDKLVMLSIDNGEYYSIGVVAKHIWTLLEKPMSIANICESLHNEFEVETALCQQDVLEFAKQMYDLKMIRTV